ncbi:hypothetical protein E2562_001435 [Oryza meyeriana var. granulata]|uniref:Uncharacterized protein n=1 Tax=Oryza meyeriana var. granulata TaxID=110450 RepID=A0A6G1DCP1_9ORYZ|nr:hypothetical protein E2562_001435 [Oryza meyeriana var. granulata]
MLKQGDGPKACGTIEQLRDETEGHHDSLFKGKGGGDQVGDDMETARVLLGLPKLYEKWRGVQGDLVSLIDLERDEKERPNRMREVVSASSGGEGGYCPEEEEGADKAGPHGSLRERGAAQETVLCRPGARQRKDKRENGEVGLAHGENSCGKDEADGVEGNPGGDAMATTAVVPVEPGAETWARDNR